MRIRPNSKCVVSLFSLAAATLLLGTTGCGLGTLAPSVTEQPSSVQGLTVQGHIHGGQQPVTGATIQLYAAGTPTSGGSYGAGATALIPSGSYTPGGASGCVTSSTVTCTSYPTTDSMGSFSITGDYTCPSASSQVYLVATGGNPGNSNGNTNGFISLIAALGSCTSTNSANKPTLSPTLYIEVDEVTTIAGVYALQQFMSAPVANTVEGIGAPGTTYNGVQTAVVGLTNAFNMVPNLVNIQTGTTPGTNSSVVVETSQINTLADILAYCINSDPSTSTYCSTLMSDATPTGSTTATDTLQAAYYMIHNPYNNVSALWKLVPTTPPYPAAGTVPYDFTLAIQYEPTYSNGSATVNALGRLNSIVLDPYGNAWVSQNGQTVNSVALPTSVVEIGANLSLLMNPTNTFTASSTGGIAGAFTTAPTSNTRTFAAFNNTYADGQMAIDLAGNTWFPNNETTGSAPASGDVAVFTGSSAANGAPGSVTGYYVGSVPSDIVVDANGDVLVASISGGGVTQAKDSSTADYANSAVDKFVAGSGTSFTSSIYTTSGQPHSLPGGNSRTFMAVGQNTAVTNTYSGGSVTNDGELLWVATQNACIASSSPSSYFGVISQYTTTDLLPTAYSELATSNGGTGAACTTTDSYIVDEFAADTANTNSIAVDKNDNIWVTDGSAYVTNSGVTTYAGLDGITFIQTTASTGAIDSSYGSVTCSFGSPGSNTFPTGGGTQSGCGTATFGMRVPFGIAIDGNNNAWVGNNGINAVSMFSATLGTSGTSGTNPSITFAALPTGPSYKHNFSAPQAPAIDASGNIWFANNGVSGQNSGAPSLPVTGSNIGSTVTILVGAAAPVVTPIAQGVKSKTVGQRP